MARKAPKRQRRARGTGSVYQRARDGLYVAKMPVGRTPQGRTVYRQVTGRTQAEALSRLKEAAPPGPGVTVGEWCRRWLDGLQVRPRTRVGYTQSMTIYVLPTLGTVRLSDLSPGQVERAIVAWGKVRGASSVRLVLAHLSIALNAARREGLIATNPVSVSRKPRMTRTKIDPFTTEEVSAIIADTAARPGCRIIATIAATGMRRGEALALDVSDYDGAAGLLSVTKTLDVAGGGHGPPKSDRGERVIRVPECVRDVLRDAAGTRVSGPLFLGERCERRLTASVLLREWRRLLVRLGLPHRGIHQLRHTWGSLAMANGGSLADVARYLGDDPATVVKFYCHATNNDPSELIDRLIGGGKATIERQGRRKT